MTWTVKDIRPGDDELLEACAKLVAQHPMPDWTACMDNRGQVMRNRVDVDAMRMRAEARDHFIAVYDDDKKPTIRGIVAFDRNGKIGYFWTKVMPGVAKGRMPLQPTPLMPTVLAEIEKRTGKKASTANTNPDVKPFHKRAGLE